MGNQTLTQNGMLYLLVTDKAKEIYSSGTFEMYLLHDDGTESLVESFYDINYALENGIPICIEVAKLSSIKEVEA